jgi:hypothetical protein
MTITATIAGAVSMLANFGLFFGGNRNNPLGLVGAILIMILAPMAVALLLSAVGSDVLTLHSRRHPSYFGEPETEFLLHSRLKSPAIPVCGVEMIVIGPGDGPVVASTRETHNHVRRRPGDGLDHRAGRIGSLRRILRDG